MVAFWEPANSLFLGSGCSPVISTFFRQTSCCLGELAVGWGVQNRRAPVPCIRLRVFFWVRIFAWVISETAVTGFSPSSLLRTARIRSSEKIIAHFTDRRQPDAPSGKRYSVTSNTVCPYRQFLYQTVRCFFCISPHLKARCLHINLFWDLIGKSENFTFSFWK